MTKQLYLGTISDEKQHTAAAGSLHKGLQQTNSMTLFVVRYKIKFSSEECAVHYI